MKHERDRLLRLKELSRLLDVGESTARTWARQGRFAVIRVGRGVRVRRREVDRLLREGVRRG